VTTFALLAIVGLLALSFWTPLRQVRRALGIEHLVASGYIFLALGAALGATDGELGARVIADLEPALGFATGWLGFAAGSRFELRVLRTVPSRAHARALAPAFAAALGVGGAATAALVAHGEPAPRAVAAALCLAAAAASAGPTLAAAVRARHAGRSSSAAVLRMVEYAGGLADLVVIALALVAHAVVQLAQPGAGPALPVLGLGCAVALGGALWLFLGARLGRDERLLLGLGGLAMVAGLGAWLGVAPIALAAVAAAVVVNLPGQRAALLTSAVQRAERPLVVVMMTVIGHRAIGATSWLVPALIVGFAVVRLAARRLAEGTATRAIEGAPMLAAPRGWSLGLVPQGVLGLLVALWLYERWGDPLALSVLAAVAGAGVLHELLAPTALVRALRRARTGAPA
jgi:hypothetical protein